MRKVPTKGGAMQIDNDELHVLSHEVVIAIGNSRHTMTFTLSTYGTLYGATATAHVLPSGARCGHCRPHLVSIHGEYEQVIVGAFRVHEEHCATLRRRKFQLVLK